MKGDWELLVDNVAPFATERVRMNFEAAFVYILCTDKASVYSTALTKQ